MRLIDADKLPKEWTDDFYETCIVLWDDILDAPTIETKEVKYFDEDEKVWKIGRVIVDE